MYISRVEVDVADRTKIKDLTHAGAFHSWVEDSFPEEKNKQIRTRKLWRIDKLDGKQYLIIVSSSTPDISSLEKYGVPNTAVCKDYTPFLESLKNGRRMFFKIALNPVKSESQGMGKRGVIKPCLTEEDQLEYLMQRAEKNGFAIEAGEFSIVEKGNVTLKKAKSASIRFVKVVYEGRLTITDAEKFKQLLSQGMGKHKAYGFGMMTVIPMGS